MLELVRIGENLTDAILALMKYIKTVTGVEPTQEEVAETLKSYFILNEIGNQIKYHLKKAADDEKKNIPDIDRPFWTLNLMSGPGRHFLARAGYFRAGIGEAIQAIRDFSKKMHGEIPNQDIIAASLRSTFILSEIKNQFEWHRNQSDKADSLKVEL